MTWFCINKMITQRAKPSWPASQVRGASIQKAPVDCAMIEKCSHAAAALCERFALRCAADARLVLCQSFVYSELSTSRSKQTLSLFQFSISFKLQLQVQAKYITRLLTGTAIDIVRISSLHDLRPALKVGR